MRNFIFFTIFSLLLIVGCKVKDKKTQKEKTKKVKIHVYRALDGYSDELTWWFYVIYLTDNSYYYIYSSTPLNTFSNSTWSKSTISLDDRFSSMKEQPLVLEKKIKELPEKMQNEDFAEIEEIEVEDTDEE